ncbi:ornithine cyclodeaminase [Plantactinospora sp. BB1]|nr:ornithine cyclodeaminase [Plantactinospora sp. BB1]
MGGFVTMETLRFLDRAAVSACLREIDPVEVVADLVRAHTLGRTTMPAEGYLSWTNGEGAYSRAIAMLGAVPAAGGGTAYGMKLINAAVSNPKHGRERAGGLSFVFDPETARPVLVAEAARLSAVRTAAYTLLSLRELGPVEPDAVTFLGAGVLASTHLELMVAGFPTLRRVYVFDVVPDRAEAFADRARAAYPRLSVEVAPDARRAVGAAPVLVTVTTSDTPYIPPSWLPSGGFVAHVSLDDLTEEAILGAEAIFVDDADLIRENPRRIMGRLMQDDKLLWTDEDGSAGTASTGRPLDGSLGQVLLGHRPARRPGTGYVVSNPFGMAVLDVGLVDAVATVAARTDAGVRLELF